MAATIHLHPTAPLAERVLLPGDPGRALALAQALLDRPRMFNHNRGLWGYTGTAGDGGQLTIQSTGMGGPSAAIVISELADLGALTLLRVGTCGALDPTLALGEIVIVTEALATDGASRALGAPARVPANEELVTALSAAAADGAGARPAPVASTDLFYEHREDLRGRWLRAGAVAVEMETATLCTLAARRGLQAAAVLVVSDHLHPVRTRIDSAGLADAESRMGALAARALAALLGA